jgi:hypothetical protein
MLFNEGNNVPHRRRSDNIEKIRQCLPGGHSEKNPCMRFRLFLNHAFFRQTVFEAGQNEPFQTALAVKIPPPENIVNPFTVRQAPSFSIPP